MKKHELIGEVAEVSAPETKSKQNGGGDYKIATLTIRQFDKDRSYLHMNGFNDIADLIGTFSKGELIIVQVDIVSRRNNMYWNTSVKVTSITRLPSSTLSQSQPVVPPDNESGIQIEDAEPGEQSEEPEVAVPKPIIEPLSQSNDELDDFEKEIIKELLYGSEKPSDNMEPEKQEITFPPVIPPKVNAPFTAEQMLELLQTMPAEKFVELIRNSSKQ